jgi:hypothetical protein
MKTVVGSKINREIESRWICLSNISAEPDKDRIGKVIDRSYGQSKMVAILENMTNQILGL